MEAILNPVTQPKAFNSWDYLHLYTPKMFFLKVQHQERTKQWRWSNLGIIIVRLHLKYSKIYMEAKCFNSSKHF